MKFEAFELDFQYRDGLYIYDGYNTTAPLIEKFSGSLRNLMEIRSPGEVIFIRFIGISDPKTVGFNLYFQQMPVSVHCNSTQIRCRNGYKCVDIKQHCNGIDDCEDGTDEQNCFLKLEDLQFKNGCGKPQIKPFDNDFRIVGGMAAKPGMSLFK